MNTPSSHSTISVVASIVTWNHAHCIEACIESLLAQTYAAVDIVVYDNASCDETREYLKRYQGRVELIYSSENLGFCGGHNAVISRTQSEFVLLVNPDVVLPTDYVEKAVKRMASDPELGTVCGLLLQSDPSNANCLIDGGGLNMSRSRHPILRFHRIPYKLVQPRLQEVFGCDGALPLFRRAMINHMLINGEFFDPMFFAHKEDHDIAWRAQILGWKTVIDPECVAIHPRHFRPGNLRLRRTITPVTKYHAVKNDLLLLFKNEDWANFVRDFLFIIPRQIAIFGYILLFERTSLKAYAFVLRNLQSILSQRKAIHAKRRASPSQVRSKFFLKDEELRRLHKSMKKPQCGV